MPSFGSNLICLMDFKGVETLTNHLRHSLPIHKITKKFVCVPISRVRDGIRSYQFN